MSFTEKIQKFCKSVNHEEAAELRQLFIDANKRLENEPGAMTMSLQKMKQEIIDQSFDWAILEKTIFEAAKTTHPEHETDKFAATWISLFNKSETISRLSQVLAHDFPNLKCLILSLADDAQKEYASLSTIAGGMHVGKTLASPWSKTPNATSKQKWEKRGIGAVEVLGGAATVNASIWSIKERVVASKMDELQKNAKDHLDELESKPDTNGLETYELKKSTNIFSDEGIKNPMSGVKRVKLDKGLFGPRLEKEYDGLSGRFDYTLNKIIPGKAQIQNAMAMRKQQRDALEKEEQERAKQESIQKLKLERQKLNETPNRNEADKKRLEELNDYLNPEATVKLEFLSDSSSDYNDGEKLLDKGVKNGEISEIWAQTFSDMNNIRDDVNLRRLSHSISRKASDLDDFSARSSANEKRFSISSNSPESDFTSSLDNLTSYEQESVERGLANQTDNTMKSAADSASETLDDVSSIEEDMIDNAL